MLITFAENGTCEEELLQTSLYNFLVDLDMLVSLEIRILVFSSYKHLNSVIGLSCE